MANSDQIPFNAGWKEIKPWDRAMIIRLEGTFSSSLSHQKTIGLLTIVYSE